MATFITSKAVGETINIYAQTSTGFWKYNHDGSDSSVFGGGSQSPTITNINGEFTIISCDSDGTVSGDIIVLYLGNNQLTSFDGTGLSSLTSLDLDGNLLTSLDLTGLTGLITLNLPNNQLTSFDGTGLSSLTYLDLNTNQFTSFDGTDLSSLTYLGLSDNQLTSFDGTGLSSLTELSLGGNLLTSFDGTGLSGLTNLYLENNQLTPSSNNQILQQFNQIGLNGGYFYSSNGRTSASNVDYDNLVSLGWEFSGLDLIIPTTFITSKAVGDSISIYAQTSTGFWKYNHNGSDSSVFSNGFGYNNSSEIGTPVTNANGEFTIIPCLSDGTVNGDITRLRLGENQLTSFDGTGLTSLTHLDLNNNQLTSFDGTGLSSLTSLGLSSNQLTTLDGFIFPTSLTSLGLSSNQLTTFDGTGLSSLIELYLDTNQLTSFDGTGLSGLNYLYLNGNPMTPSVNNQILHQLALNGLSGGEFYSSNGRTLASNADYDNLLNSLGWYFEGLDVVIPTTFITSKSVDETITISVQTSTGYWKYNHDGIYSEDVFDQNNGTQTIPVRNINGEFTIISCLSDGTVSGDITVLNLGENQLTSFDGTGLSGLTQLGLNNNQLTSFDGTGLSSLTVLGLYSNQLTSFDGTGLSSLTELGLQGNLLTSLDISPLVDLSYLCLFEMGQKGNPDLTNPITTLSNNQILFDLAQHSINGGTFISTGGRTSASNVDYDNLVNNLWSFQGLDLIAVGNGKLRVKGFRPTQPQPWDGGTIYNIGAVVTHEGQTWNCIQYAPSGYGPFGGYIDVYWTL